MIARPDPDTFAIIPWRSAENACVARMFCDVYEPSGRPFEGDPRFAVLKRKPRQGKRARVYLSVGPELEYFYFSNAQSPQPLDQAVF
jgi:glutamine synthetase